MATTPFRVTPSAAVASPSTTAVIAPPNIQQCMQLIFELIDHLTSWIHEEASSDPSHHHPSASAESGTTNPATRTDSPHLIVQPVVGGGGGPICRSVIDRKRFLDSIDKSTLANAAHACNAHTRAYKYYESYLHEERQKVRRAHAAAIPEKIKATASSKDARLARLGQPRRGQWQTVSQQTTSTFCNASTPAWMNPMECRASLPYDPHHLLCQRESGTSSQ